MNQPFLRGLLLAGSLALLGGCGDDTRQSTDDVTDIPETPVRNQQDTGNCWLYSTLGWVESLEYSALIHKGLADPSNAKTAPAHFSPAYLDYWDWHWKITHGAVKHRSAANVSDELDSGGSWGQAADIIARHGLMRTQRFLGSGASLDASVATSALAAMTKSLTKGALATAAARKDGALVRHELDRAFGLGKAVSAELTAAFGADGAGSFADGSASRTAAADVIPPDGLEVLLPRRDADPELHALSDALGVAAGDDPDQRQGEMAWSVASFEPSAPAATREYFRRIQRALHAGAPLPLSWYVASNGDPDGNGTYTAIPAGPADADDSGAHLTLLDDYQVSDVPGYGTLAAGVPASAEEEQAALDDAARIVFLRVRNSWGKHVSTNRGDGHDDLYVEYLTGTLRVCPKGKPNSKDCTSEVPLEDVALPAGF